MSDRLPWQESQWQQLVRCRIQGRMPHAVLLSGPAGTGKGQFARRWLASLLCAAPAGDGEPCAQCRPCQLYAAGNHPDYQIIGPEEAGKPITVDQIRAITHFLALKPQFSGAKAVVIEPAEAMNMHAANSLLKTLEEPAAAAVLVLVSSRPASLTATVRSRCQQLQFPKPDAAQARVWLAAQRPDQDPESLLAMAEGAPMAALGLADGGLPAQRQSLLQGLVQLAEDRGDPLPLAEQGLKIGASHTLTWMYSWLADLIRLCSAERPPRLANEDAKDALQALARRAERRALYATLDRVHSGIGLLEGQTNRQLILEEAFISWSQTFKSRKDRRES